MVEKANQPAYPFFGQTYKECKDNELAKGLDLEGGMSVTLEVSIPDMVKNIAGSYAKRTSFSAPFDAAYSSFSSNGNERPFVDLFEEKYNEMSPDENLEARGHISFRTCCVSASCIAACSSSSSVSARSTFSKFCFWYCSSRSRSCELMLSRCAAPASFCASSSLRAAICAEGQLTHQITCGHTQHA